jgi:hypothetical protein
MENREKIMDIIKLFNIEYYNLNGGYVCLKGINGHATIVKFDNNPITSIKQHLIQVGRDSLKMDLNYLLDITRHH